jgi:hypothetical protein
VGLPLPLVSVPIQLFAAGGLAGRFLLLLGRFLLFFQPGLLNDLFLGLVSSAFAWHYAGILFHEKTNPTTAGGS